MTKNMVDQEVIPLEADQGLAFQKIPGDVYDWLGFEASQLIFDFLKEVAGDETMFLDFFAYDLNEPSIVDLLEKIGGRLRAILDDSGDHKRSCKRGVTGGVAADLIGRCGERPTDAF